MQRYKYIIALVVCLVLLIIFSCASNPQVINEPKEEKAEVIVETQVPRVQYNIVYAKWFDAVNYGNTNVLGLMLEQGFEINSIGSRPEGFDYGYTALMLASSLGDYNTVMFLLNKNANINLKTIRGSALLAAISNNQTRIARILIARNSDVNISSVDGRTPLMAAAENGNYEICLSLIKNGASIQATHSSGNRAIDYARANGHADIVDILASN